MNAGGGPGILRLGGVDKLPVALPSSIFAPVLLGVKGRFVAVCFVSLYPTLVPS